MSAHLLMLTLLMNRRRQKLGVPFLEKRTLEGRRRRDRRIGRALQHPKMSTFVLLLGSGCDKCLITLTGFDFKTFHVILDKFRLMYKTFAIF